MGYYVYLYVSNHLSVGNVLEFEGFVEDPVAEQSPFFCLLLPVLVEIFDEGGEGSDEGGVEIMLVANDGPGEEVELQVVHLFLAEKTQQFGGLVLAPIG